MFGKHRLLLRCFLLLLLPLALLCPKGVISAEVKISSTSDFVNFAGNVNSGTDDYSETTVLLDSDLSLSGKTLEPIGNNTYYFRGIFDGQGHIISNFKMSSSYSYYTGLFGYSRGLTIKNVVLDSSCSITSSFNGSSYVYVGGIIGRCYAGSGQCNTENSVNMAVVTFSGNITDYSDLNLGGVAGRLYSSYSYPAYMKNCANYGPVTHSGTTKYSYLGGIIGYLESSNSNYAYTQNILNYGTITHSGTTTNYLRIGGIVGHSECAYIENCVSAGSISSTETRYIGSIVGYVYSSTSINHCYYTSDLSSFSLYGTGTPESESYTLSYDNITFELSESVSVGSYTGTSLTDALNAYSDYYLLRDYSKWLLNKNSKTATFTINSRTSPITMNSKVILLPSLASEGSTFFDGWYTDNNYATPLSSFEITGDTGLYGKFKENTKEYTITFDSRREGVSVAQITAQSGSTVSLPRDVTREYCSVVFWETGYGDNMGLSLTMPAHNFTLYAVWKCTHITRIDDFIDFSKVVNSGVSYYGTTVLLDSDLSLSDKTLEPIGNDDDDYFRGVFDGQGHIISNLKMNSSQYAGLFGYSGGLTIKNVVLDSSCSITSYYYSSSERAYVGGIIGYCSGQCNIENNVNMADVTFSGNSYNLRLGGIAGELYPSSTNSYVKNCANYGSVLKNGVVDTWSNIGGVIAFIESSHSSYTYVYNCINYGTVTHKNSSKYIYIGGILGSSYDKTYIENCVSAGKISVQTTATYNEIGNIVGYIESYSSIYIKNCYYSDELDNYKLYSGCGYAPISGCSKYNSTTFELGGTVSVGSYTGTSLIDALNAYSDYYLLRDYSKWLLNKNSKTATFTINSRASPITMNSKVILLPSLASEGSTFFDGWYTDNNCANPLSSFEITGDTGLYGKFKENTKNYTITFDTKGGSYVAPITAQFGSTVSLPRDVTRDNCSVAFWENKYGDNMGLSLTMPAHNFVLYAVWKCTHITRIDDFIDFSKAVNSGVSYSGTTVLLGSDLSLSDKTLEPIGNDDDDYFRGVFDGQGHIISNLKMNSSQYAGLFGYSYGLTIKNVVLDSSCSITSFYNDSNNVYVGGIIGYCYGQCNIENSVNMASATFSGYIGNNNLYLGGIAGYLESYSYSSSYPAYVKNCANYGSVTHSGTSRYSYIGGIIGYLEGYRSNYGYVQNCLNYGTITHSGTTSNTLYTGGISGYSEYSYIENCVSAGSISLQTTPSYNYTGSIVGYVYSPTYINHSFWSGGVRYNKTSGHGSPGTDNETAQAEVDTALVGKLNGYSANNSWNNWTMLHINGGKICNVNQDSLITPSKHFPVPVKEGYTLAGWFKDAMLSETYDPNENGTCADAYARFTPNDYTVTLNATGGSVSTPSVTVTFDSAYGELPMPNRTGYTFVRWSNEMNESVTSETIMKTPSNHTLYAQWEEVPTSQVEIVFGSKDLDREDIVKIVKEYTNAEFEIVLIEDDDVGEKRVIIKFTGTEEAEEFVRNVRTSAKKGDIEIKEIGYSTEEFDSGSFSWFLHPLLFISVLVMWA